MRRMWSVLGTVCTLLMFCAAQEQPLINYAGGYGSFDYDFYIGNPSVGLVRDGIAEGFTVSAAPDFSLSLDEEDKVQGLASQRVSFNRNASGTATASLSYTMRFPSTDYPQVGETVRIRLWVKAANWNNARFQVLARGISGSGTQTLLETLAPPNSWTQLDFNYTVPTSNPAGIVVELRVDALSGVAQGTIWYDDLTVTGSQRWRPHTPRSLKIISPYNPNAHAEAQYDWVLYAREFDAVIARWDVIKQLRTHRPDLRNIVYYNLIYSNQVPSQNQWSLSDLYGYWYCDVRHPDWFLLNVFGQRQRFGSNLHLMDIGNPVTSNWAAQNLALYMRYADSNVDIIHFDSFIDFFFGSYHLQRYPTQASRMAAMNKHLRNMRAVTQDRNIQFIINAAGAAYTREAPQTYFLRQGLLDGMLVEQAFTNIFSLPTGFVSFTTWLGQFTTLVENAPRPRVVYSGYGVSNPVEGRRQKIYALASFLLCADDNIYLYLDKHYYDGQPNRQRSWRPDADFDVPLGQPTGAHEVYFRSSDYQGGLYYRPFQNGFVLVNPTGNNAVNISGVQVWKDGAVFSWILDADYWELWSGQVFPAGTRIKIYPKQARIFVRANSAALRNYPPAKGKIRPAPESGGKVEPISGGAIPRR